MRLRTKMTLTSTVLLLVGFMSFAQDTPPPPMPPPPPGLPIDEPVIILVVVAICYGIFSALKLSKPSN